MTKSEIEKILIKEYGYKKSDLKDDKGNPLLKKELEEMLSNEESKKEQKEQRHSEVKKEEEKKEDLFEVDETIFESKHQLKDDDLILCMSGVNGEMDFVSQLSNFRVTTRNFGQTVKIPYKDLSYVHSIAPEAFEDGTIVVLNKDVQEEFGLVEIYKRVLTPKNIDKVIDMEPEELEEFINTMPKAMNSALYDEARKMYRQGKIDSRKTLQVFEDAFNISFDDNAPVSDRVNG